jgi:hypothetical protein
MTTQSDLDRPAQSQQVPMIIEDEEDIIPQNASAKFLQWHHKLGHVSPKIIEIRAKIGILPRQLADCHIPLCTACLFGKATKEPWRTSKTPAKRYPGQLLINKAGHCVSVHQLESSTPGLIVQLHCIPTVMQYTVATLFIDHYSGLGYIHLQKSTSDQETVEAKQAFKRYTAAHGVHILCHYHANKGCFVDSKF